MKPEKRNSKIKIKMEDNFTQQFFGAIESLIPHYSSNPLDAFANGNVAICVIDEEGDVQGKIWGNDKLTGRNFYKNAWIKASQVWITGMKTGEYEVKLYTGEFDEEFFGISKPDLIGWEGGQPITLKNGSKLFVGFSGFRGENDLDIVTKAITIIENN
jgi:uncharacterized protein GlcG (DUF336 family)